MLGGAAYMPISRLRWKDSVGIARDTSRCVLNSFYPAQLRLRLAILGFPVPVCHVSCIITSSVHSIIVIVQSPLLTGTGLRRMMMMMMMEEKRINRAADDRAMYTRHTQRPSIRLR